MSTATPPSNPTQSSNALDMVGLVKVFGSKVAVDNLYLSIPTGSIYGVVGPNGAGKTTTLSMTTGLLTPDHGKAYVLGVDVWAQPRRAKGLLGVLPDGLRTFDRLSGAELLTYCGLLRGMEREQVLKRTQQLLLALGLADTGNKLVADYSAGMRKKINLACALIHAPSVLVLDEPFEAVDPVSAQAIIQILHEFVSRGGTVVLSSHVMDTVAKLCTHVAVINAGRVVSCGTVAQVADGMDLNERFVQLVGGPMQHEEMTWLHIATLIYLKLQLKNLIGRR